MRQKLLSSATVATAALALAVAAAPPGQAQTPKVQPAPSGQPRAPSPGGPAPTSPVPAPVQTTPTPPDLNNPTTFLPFVYGPLQQQNMDVPAANPRGKVHLLPATPATTQWGWFDNAQPPVLRIAPGCTPTTRLCPASPSSRS